MLPAHKSKHNHSLNIYHFSLAQSDTGLSNGTTLWLGAQCLSAYLRAYSKPASRVIELGSGIGLTALVLADLGWKEVYATDTSTVIQSVLARNIANNPVQGTIHVQELDWQSDDCSSLSSSPFDLIVTADTVYEPSLVQPLFRTIHTLCVQSRVQSRAPPVLLCLERRDPALIDHVLQQATTEWQFHVERIPSRKLSKAMQKDGIHWDKADWEGVELWKLTL
ncbi:hypothetical protein VKT23_004064 [Stygiomarasmius scandens]|uniref:Methyltransferase-domain-containing protein n=1 Tax=Marasmiellus scandens TaxID=2682957 RepID=A0ABR1JXG6_9AGAR